MQVQVKPDSLFQLALDEKAYLLSLVQKSLVGEQICDSAFQAELKNRDICQQRWISDFGGSDVFRCESLGGGRHDGAHPIKVVSEKFGTWVYKPRSGKTETWLQGLFEKLNITGLHVPQTLDKGEYHWSKWVDDIGSQGDMLDSEVYRLYGVVWVVWSVLGGTDLHRSNVILSPKGLWLIDGETLTSHQVSLKDAVNSTGLIGPHLPWKRSTSALANHPRNHLPVSPPQQYIETILLGVAEAIELFQKHADEIQSHLDLLSDILVRYIARGNSTYAKFWRDIGSIHSHLSGDELKEQMKLYMLVKGLEPFVSTEIESLLRGDIPIFFYIKGWIINSEGKQLKEVGEFAPLIIERIQELHLYPFEKRLVNSLTPSDMQQTIRRLSWPLYRLQDWVAGKV